MLLKKIVLKKLNIKNISVHISNKNIFHLHTNAQKLYSPFFFYYRRLSICQGISSTMAAPVHRYSSTYNFGFTQKLILVQNNTSTHCATTVTLLQATVTNIS